MKSDVIVPVIASLGSGFIGFCSGVAYKVLELETPDPEQETVWDTTDDDPPAAEKVEPHVSAVK